MKTFWILLSPLLTDFEKILVAWIERKLGFLLPPNSALDPPLTVLGRVHNISQRRSCKWLTIQVLVCKFRWSIAYHEIFSRRVNFTRLRFSKSISNLESRVVYTSLAAAVLINKIFFASSARVFNVFLSDSKIFNDRLKCERMIQHIHCLQPTVFFVFFTKESPFLFITFENHYYHTYASYFQTCLTCNFIVWFRKWDLRVQLHKWNLHSCENVGFIRIFSELPDHTWLQLCTLSTSDLRPTYSASIFLGPMDLPNG